MRLIRRKRQVHRVTITREEYGEQWPFIDGIEKGTLERQPITRGRFELSEIRFVTMGKTYALNGIAKQSGHLPLEEIWRFDPHSDGKWRVNIGPLISRGLSLEEHTDHASGKRNVRPYAGLPVYATIKNNVHVSPEMRTKRKRADGHPLAFSRQRPGVVTSDVHHTRAYLFEPHYNSSLVIRKSFAHIRCL